MVSFGAETIVIEGLGGVGKTTTAQILAEEHGYSNFNTGSLFRAAAAAVLEGSISLQDINDFVEESDFAVDLEEPSAPLVAVAGRDVSHLLQNPDVTRLASRIGTTPQSAGKLERIFDSLLTGGSLVVEGKHIGDRVLTMPGHRFFLVANQEVRVQRKYRQAVSLGRSAYTLSRALEDVAMNDARDKKLLTIVESTHVIDTSMLTPQQVVNGILRHRNQSRQML